eukprot:TRINITY_DN55051_c0_g1_i1.p2 TRINITY_DN55051_c0_g1~~TRINITY_DN55051_c0_g1_i1.p2  ORF type:complete len:433 (+),score=136.85 TRINITY_DN55051_c0_g1_i1:116-1414(+)
MPEPERRRSPLNGRMYTKAQFQQHFHGLREWDAAAPGPSEEGPDSAEASAEGTGGEERRRSPMNRRYYTQEQFVAHFGGTAEWEAAAPTAQVHSTAAAPNVETRRCPRDGRFHTKEHFLATYGGEEEWIAAEEEKRVSPANGRHYTKRQFQTYFRGSREWDAAPPAPSAAEMEGWAPLPKANDKGERDKHGVSLKDGNGRMLKPVQTGGRSEVEVAAYEALAQGPLARYLPKCWGLRELQGQTYLELEDLLHGLEEPYAFIDIKIGKKTFEDDAPPDKKEKEMQKNAPGTTGEIGYRLVGVRCGSTYELMPAQIKARGGLRQFAFIQEAVTPFFSDAEHSDPASFWPAFNCKAMDKVLQELRQLADIAAKGFGASLRAASIFMAREMKEDSEPRVRLIDFAHYSPCEDVDENFVEGLRAVINAFEERRRVAP